MVPSPPCHPVARGLPPSPSWACAHISTLGEVDQSLCRSGAGLQEQAPWDCPASLGRDGSPKVQGREACLLRFPQLPNQGGNPTVLSIHCSLLNSREQTLHRGVGARMVRCRGVTATSAFCPLSVPSPSLHAVWKGQQQYLGVNPRLTHSLIHL